MNIYHLRNQLAHSKEWLITAMLPDTCQLTPPANGYTVDGFGIPIPTTASPKTWRGSTDIPCLFEISRAMRNDQLPEIQTTVVTEYHVQLPYDVDVSENDILTHDGVSYEIRRLKNASEFDLLREATVARSTLTNE